MSAQSIHHLGFLMRSAGRDDPGPDRNPPSAIQDAHPHGATEVLSEWRAAERALTELEPGTDAWAQLSAEVERLRERYRDVFDATAQSGPSGQSDSTGPST